MFKIERPGVGDFAREYDSTVMGLSSYFAGLMRRGAAGLTFPAVCAIVQALNKTCAQPAASLPPPGIAFEF